MSGVIHAKKVGGRKVWYVWGATGNRKWEIPYPQCQSTSEFYDALGLDLGLPRKASRTDIVFALFTKTWTGTRWEDDFALRLKALREEAGLTQAALAARAALSVQAISALELSARSPTWETVRKLALALGVEEKDFKDTLPEEQLRKMLNEAGKAEV